MVIYLIDPLLRIPLALPLPLQNSAANQSFIRSTPEQQHLSTAGSCSWDTLAGHTLDMHSQGIGILPPAAHSILLQRPLERQWALLAGHTALRYMQRRALQWGRLQGRL